MRRSLFWIALSLALIVCNIATYAGWWDGLLCALWGVVLGSYVADLRRRRR
jgi:CHASE2 domain-containing sensor protein